MNLSKALKACRFDLLLLVFLLASLCLLEKTKTQTPKEHFAVMLDASHRAETAFSAIRAERLARGHAISPIEDPNGTGMVGESFTEITTTLGNLEAKRSTANPNTAAMITDMLVQCGVKKGSFVAVNLSSSFPALNISLLCALDALDAEGIIINSVGASTYGANLPDFTYLDMEQSLLEKGLITNHSRWFSMGGADDIGKEMPAETKKAITDRLTGYGLHFIYCEDLAENLTVRQNIYLENASDAKGNSPQAPACFVNVGGNLLSFGSSPEMVSARSGILRPNELPSGRPLPGVLSLTPAQDARVSAASSEAGLIPRFLDDGIPVIHLLNMKSLLPAYGLPFDPSPIPSVGEGGVYTQWRYNRPLALLLLIGALALFILAVRRRPRRKFPL